MKEYFTVRELESEAYRYALPKDALAKKSTRAAFEWLERVAITLAVIFLLLSLCFGVCRVGDDTMNDTFWEGSTLLLSHMDSIPETGDVIAYQFGTDATPYLSRVIATEGQIVDYHSDKGLTVDGVAVTLPGGMVKLGNYPLPCTVPDHCVFVMGDNASYTLDTNHPTCGIVDNRFLLGKVIYGLSPFGSVNR